MSLNSTPAANRIHIGFFGRRNSGKSSIVNAVTGQNLAIVSDIKGTTTDPVYKAMELLPLGPVMLIDTAGIDDDGELGEKRVKKTFGVLGKTDAAVLVADAVSPLSAEELELIEKFKERNIPYCIAYNKTDLLDSVPPVDGGIYVSAKERTGIEKLKERIAEIAITATHDRSLIGDLVNANDFIVIVVLIDESAPKGRLILPQQQVIRDLLEAGAVSVVTKESELEELLQNIGKKPSLVITDSQVFSAVSNIVPCDIKLTSFSIIMARYKGVLDSAVKGVNAFGTLNDGDTVLISEGCTHHRQCNDIGTVKLPNMLRKYTGKSLNFMHTSGTEYPETLKDYSLVIHCGGCMLNEREVLRRIRLAEEQNVPITNYGVAMAYMNGILERSVEIFTAEK